MYSSSSLAVLQCLLCKCSPQLTHSILSLIISLGLLWVCDVDRCSPITIYNLATERRMTFSGLFTVVSVWRILILRIKASRSWLEHGELWPSVQVAPWHFRVSFLQNVENVSRETVLHQKLTMQLSMCVLPFIFYLLSDTDTYILSRSNHSARDVV